MFGRIYHQVGMVPIHVRKIGKETLASMNLTGTLSGDIPELSELLYLLFENNQLTGNISSTIGLVYSLEVLCLDRNLFSGLVPPNLNNLTNVNELFLSNNRLTGPLPNLTGMNSLYYVDMSNNTFDVSDFPLQFTTLRSLTTIVIENTNVQGQVPLDPYLP